MSKMLVAAATVAALACAGVGHAEVKASTRNGAVAGAVGGAVVAGPVGAVVGGVGGAVVGHHYHGYRSRAAYCRAHHWPSNCRYRR